MRHGKSRRSALSPIASLIGFGACTTWHLATSSPLHLIQEHWLALRERLPTPIDGWVDNPDHRDIFSFRGITGGGRRRADEPASVIASRPQENPKLGGRRPRRRRRRR